MIRSIHKIIIQWQKKREWAYIALAPFGALPYYSKRDELLRHETAMIEPCGLFYKTKVWKMSEL